MTGAFWHVVCRFLAIGLVAALVLDGSALMGIAGDDGDDDDWEEQGEQWGDGDGDDEWEIDDREVEREGDDDASRDEPRNRRSETGRTVQAQTGSVTAQDDDDDDDDDDDCEIEFEADDDDGAADGYCADQAITRLIPGIDVKAINSAFGTETIDFIAGHPLYLLRLPQNSDETSFAALLADDPRIQWAELNFIDQAPEGSPRRFYLRADEAAPVASNLDRVYAPALIGAPAALACVDGDGVTVAVIDSGIDPDHPAFATTTRRGEWNAFSNQDGAGNVDDIGNSEDDDGDGLIDEMTGHGTHVAGIVIQIAPGVTIMPIKALDSDGVGQAFYLARALYRALDRNADVVNLSLGSTANSRVIRDAAGDAVGAGIFVAAAAGNSGPAGPREYPATLDDGFRILGVAATDRQDRPAVFSSTHRSLDLSAPGDGIVSAFPIDQPPDNKLSSPYALWSGTSMSTAWVSGGAALLLDRNPDWTPAQIGIRLRETATPINGPIEGMGSGRIDVGAAVDCEQEARARDDTKPDKKTKNSKKGKKDKGKNTKKQNRR